MSAGARIHLFRSVRSLGASASFAIDRIKPAVLHPHWKSDDWLEFCDQIDDAFVALNKSLKVIRFLFMIIVLSLVLYLAGFILYLTPIIVTLSAMMAGLGIWLAMVILLLAYKVRVSNLQNKAMAVVIVLCEQLSERYRQKLSFHATYSIMTFQDFYPDRAYIDVYLDPELGYIAPNPSTDSAEYDVGRSRSPPYHEETSNRSLISTNPNLSFGSEKSTQRSKLEQLELLRYELTDKEYQERRARIQRPN